MLNDRKYIIALFIVAVTALNLLLAALSWQDLKSSLFWITNIHQSSDIKIRHFVQYSPQAYLLLLLLRHFSKFTPGQATIFSFAAVALLGVISEGAQFFTPTRIPAFADVMWNILASAYGCAVFWTFHHWRLQNSKLYRLKVPLMLLLVTGSIWLLHHDLASLPFSFDDSKILSTLRSSEVLTAEYWGYIFTNPHHGNVQYRPLSYFAFYNVLSQLVTVNPTVIFALSALAILVFCFFFQKWTKSVFRSEALSLLIPMLLLIHPVLYSHLPRVANQAKYLFTLALLFIILEQVQRDSFKRASNLVLSVGLLSVAILLHEGTITFAFIALLWVYAQKKTFKKQHLFLLIPAATYLLFRFFVWGVPESKAMAVSFTNIFNGYSYYLLTPLLDYNPATPWSEKLLLLIGFYATPLATLMAFSHRQARQSAFLLISIFLVLAPFAALKVHRIDNRAIWALPFILLYWGTFLIQLKNLFNLRLPRKVAWAPIFATIVLSLTYYITVNLNRTMNHRNYIASERRSVHEFRSHMNNLLLNHQGTSDKEYIEVYLNDDVDHRHGSFVFNMTLGSLAYYYPQYNFKLNSKQDLHLVGFAHRGVPIKVYNQSLNTLDLGHDIYGYTRDLNFTQPVGPPLNIEGPILRYLNSNKIANN